MQCPNNRAGTTAERALARCSVRVWCRKLLFIAKVRTAVRAVSLRAARYNRPAMPYEYDVIVAGAGSGGCVAAARISEDPSIRVLLIESGPDYPNLESLPEDLRNVNHASFTDHDWLL